MERIINRKNEGSLIQDPEEFVHRLTSKFGFPYDAQCMDNLKGDKIHSEKGNVSNSFEAEKKYQHLKTICSFSRKWIELPFEILSSEWESRKLIENKTNLLNPDGHHHKANPFCQSRLRNLNDTAKKDL